MPVDVGSDTGGTGNPWDSYLADFFAQLNDMFSMFGSGGGGSAFNYKPFALKDIGLQEDLLQLDRKSGLQDIRNAKQALRLGTKSSLQDIRAAREQLRFERRTGLRDIGLARKEGMESVRDDSLARGLFNSGIRTSNQNRVSNQAGRASSDLLSNFRRGIRGVNQDARNIRAQFKLGMKGYNQDIGNLKKQISLSMKRLANQRAEIQARPLGGGGGGGFGFNPSDIFNLVNSFGGFGVNSGSFNGGTTYTSSDDSGTTYKPPPNLVE